MPPAVPWTTAAAAADLRNNSHAGGSAAATPTQQAMEDDAVFAGAMSAPVGEEGCAELAAALEQLGDWSVRLT